MDFGDQKEFNEPHVFDDPKRILIGESHMSQHVIDHQPRSAKIIVIAVSEELHLFCHQRSE